MHERLRSVNNRLKRWHGVYDDDYDDGGDDDEIAIKIHGCGLWQVQQGVKWPITLSTTTRLQTRTFISAA